MRIFWQEVVDFFSAIMRYGVTPEDLAAGVAKADVVMPQIIALLRGPKIEILVQDLNLSVRAQKILTRLGITTVSELIQKTSDDILEVRNSGVTTLHEIQAKLTKFGLRLREPQPPA